MVKNDEKWKKMLVILFQIFECQSVFPHVDLGSGDLNASGFFPMHIEGLVIWTPVNFSPIRSKVWWSWTWMKAPSLSTQRALSWSDVAASSTTWTGRPSRTSPMSPPGSSRKSAGGSSFRWNYQMSRGEWEHLDEVCIVHMFVASCRQTFRGEWERLDEVCIVYMCVCCFLPSDIQRWHRAEENVPHGWSLSSFQRVWFLTLFFRAFYYDIVQERMFHMVELWSLSSF